MDKRDKAEFVTNALNMLRDTIIGSIDSMPDRWDGVELRWYIRDKAGETLVWGDHSHKRKREYENDRMIQNL